MVKYNSQVYFHLIRTKQSFPPHQLIKSNFVADRNDIGQPQRKNEHWMFEHFPKHLNRLIIYNMILYQFQYQQKPLDGVYLLKSDYLSTRGWANILPWSEVHGALRKWQTDGQYWPVDLLSQTRIDLKWPDQNGHQWPDGCLTYLVKQ